MITSLCWVSENLQVLYQTYSFCVNRMNSKQKSCQERGRSALPEYMVTNITKQVCHTGVEKYIDNVEVKWFWTCQPVVEPEREKKNNLKVFSQQQFFFPLKCKKVLSEVKNSFITMIVITISDCT